jgi:thymidylate synthase (FAD)
VARILVPEAEEMLDREIPVLDQGFVRLIDYLGGDARIVAAARVSYGSGTKTVREDDRLINYLMRNGHSSPFEQVLLTFHVKLPVFVARQWVRHRTARLNEVSGRYSILSDEFYLPELSALRWQSQRNRQGRSDEELPRQVQEEIVQMLAEEQRAIYSNYESMLASGLTRELARINLPLSLYTQWYWQIDLHNLFNFLRYRLDKHAQYEIRCYAEVVANMARAVAPLAYAAFEDHVLHAVTLSKSNKERLISLLRSLDPESADVQALLKGMDL